MDFLNYIKTVKEVSMVNSRDKGKRGELEAAHYLSQWFQAKRGQQFKGSPDSPDVEFTGQSKILNNFLYIEVKRNEHLNIDKAMEQAKSEAPYGAWPVVMHRKNDTPWKITISADDYMELFSQWYVLNK